ncbi:uncharacterized protein LOC143918454 [Arctopsyche grandis]|uniref:uncharacterized protein LOC143918454 n=1 Tax=Arctopsyche grandis TaxID=121162 RepID=UPI00406D7036
MIRRRSYIEAIGEGAFIGDSNGSDNESVNETECFSVVNMSRSYISSSSDESTEDSGEFRRNDVQFRNKTKSNDVHIGQNAHETVNKQSEKRVDEINLITRSNDEVNTRGLLVRDDSLKYHNMKPEVSENQSLNEIYNTCLNFVSYESLHSRRGDRQNEFNELHKILAEGSSSNSQNLHLERSKMPVKVDLECGNRTSIHFNVNDMPDDVGDLELRIVENGDVEKQSEEIQSAEANVNTNVFEDIFTATDEDEVFYDENKDNTSSEKYSNFPLQYVGRNSARKKRKTPENCGNRSRRSKRVVFKNGQTNIPLMNNILGRYKIYMDDYVTTLIECEWRWLALSFSACNILLWVAFALMYYVAAYANGDLVDKPEGIMCIAEGRTFTGIFTFSVETQVSIGYGEKYPTEECPEIAFILLMEVVVGNALIGVMVSIVFVKITRPEKHLEGVGFSKNSVVCLRDGKLCLVFRVWDCLRKHVAGTQIKGWFIKHTVASGPLILPISFGKSPFLLWPTTIQHVIDEKSPLYDISAKDLLDKKFEIIITLTGSARSSGQMTQSRTSYMSHEILWGSKFKEVVSYSFEDEGYVIDGKSINTVEPMDIPLCSARLLQHFNKALQGGPASISLPASPIFLSPRDSLRSVLVSPSWSFKVRSFKTELNTSLP